MTSRCSFSPPFVPCLSKYLFTEAWNWFFRGQRFSFHNKKWNYFKCIFTSLGEVKLTWRYHLEAGWPLFPRAHLMLENKGSIPREVGQSGEAEDRKLKSATVQVCGALFSWLRHVVQKNMYEVTLISHQQAPPHPPSIPHSALPHQGTLNNLEEP